jgi:hypothetical protein
MNSKSRNKFVASNEYNAMILLQLFFAFNGEPHISLMGRVILGLTVLKAQQLRIG